MTTAALSPLATAPPPEPRRARVLLIGSAFGSVASALVVLSTLAVYLQLRDDFLDSGNAATPEGFVLPLTPGGMCMVTLLMSLVTVAWRAIDFLHHEVMAHQVGEGYEKGYEHGYLAAVKHMHA